MCNEIRCDSESGAEVVCERENKGPSNGEDAGISVGREGSRHVVMDKMCSGCGGDTEDGLGGVRAIARQTGNRHAVPKVDRPVKAKVGYTESTGERITAWEGFEVSQKGLRVNETCTVENWETFVKNCAVTLREHGMYKFWIGDLLNAGERLYGEDAVIQRISSIVELLNDHTIANMQSVARNVPIEIRYNVNVLSWSSHRAVAYMELGEQKRYLDMAASEGWSNTTLEARIKADRYIQLAEGASSDEERAKIQRYIDDEKPTLKDVNKVLSGEKEIVLKKEFEEWVREVTEEENWDETDEVTKLERCWYASRLNIKKGKKAN